MSLEAEVYHNLKTIAKEKVQGRLHQQGWWEVGLHNTPGNKEAEDCNGEDRWIS